MLLDTQSMFSDAQAITADAPSTNVIDLGSVLTPTHAAGPITRDLGKGRPIPILVQVVEDFATLTSLTVKLQKDTTSDFSSPTDVDAGPTVALADLVAGKRLTPFWLPEGLDERYVRLYYEVAGTDPTAGKVTAGLIFGRAGWTA